MIFCDAAHKEFFLKNKVFAGSDVYTLPLIYLLGLTEDTRRNFNRIYDIKKKEIDIEQLSQGWQTGTTVKITRLAFNLFNGFVFEDLRDFNDDRVSSKYAVDNIFCCSLAPYFWEAIKLRFPEYCTGY